MVADTSAFSLEALEDETFDDRDTDDLFSRISPPEKARYDTQTKFLRGLAVGGTNLAGLSMSGVHRRTIWQWKTDDTLGFRERYDKAKEHFTDSLETIALNLVKQLGPGNSPVLLITLLNANLPEKYRPNVTVSDDTAKETLNAITKAAKKVVKDDTNKDRAREATAEDKVVSFIERKSG